MAEVLSGMTQQWHNVASKPYLLILNGPQAGNTVELDCEHLKDEPLILGRGGAKARVRVGYVLQDPGNRASSVHAAISYREDDQCFLVTDQGSSNGTRLNGQFTGGTTPMFGGDTLTIGTLEIMLMLPDPEGETGYAQSIPRKRGGLSWELLEDGEPGVARLEVVENQLRNPQGQPEPPRVGSFYRLTPNHPFYVGRFVTNDLQVPDILVGRRHAEIRWGDNSYVISDMGAAQPAVVNGDPLAAPRRLSEGDEIVVGRLVLRYRAPRRAYIPQVRVEKDETKTGVQGGALRFALADRPLQLGPDFIRLPINRQILVGRDEVNDLRLHHQSVSRRHVKLAVESGHFMITDLGSANGTMINGLEIGGPTVLKPGDRVKIGDFEFLFEEVDEEDHELYEPEDTEDEEEAETLNSEEINPDITPPISTNRVKHPLLIGEPLTLELTKRGASGEAADGSGSNEKLAQATETIIITHPLRTISPFDKMDTSNFNLLVKYFREVTFKAGQEIAREGQERGAFYAILEGTVVISRALDQGRSRLVLGELGPGTVYGERTIFADQPFVNRLEAKTQVRALILEEAVFVRELARNRTIASFFQQQVSTNSAANWLRGTLLMQTLSDQTRQALAGRLRYRVYAAGETLAKKGDPCEEFFLIVGGAAQAYSVDNKGNEQSLTMLEEGDNFGDGIAAQGETYPMTVRAERQVECYVLARADFQNVLQKSGDPIASLGRGMSGLPLGAVLNRIPPFNTMPPQLVAQIGSRMKVKFFKKGEVIAWQGDRSSALYIVRSGQVQLSHRASDGTVRQDAKLGPGQFFGEASLLQETVHNATVTAIDDCELLTLFRNKLQEVMALGEGYDLARFFKKNLERRFRPKRVENFRVSEQTNAEGEVLHILSTENGENFFQLGDRGYFLWQRMDGDNTISDLALDYFMEYKVLDLEAVSNIVGQLQAAGFLEVPAVNQSLIASEEQGKGGSKLARYFTYRHEINNIDTLVERIYRFGGKILFFKPVLWLLFATMGLGFVSFFYFAFFSGQDASFLIKPPISVFTGKFWWFLIIFTLFNFAIHEVAHALACKSYGRKVSRGGFGWMYVGPYFFVNTDDIYLEPRKARIAVDLAGPLANLLIGGVCCLLMFLNSDNEYRTFMFQMVSVAYIVAYLNIIPLTESDGYYALSNWLEIPSLRKKALVWMRRTILRQPQTRVISARERKIFFWFALLTPVYLVIIMVQFVLWLSNILNALLEGWLSIKAPFIGIIVAVVAAIAVTLPLFADLWAVGRSEDEKENEKKKKARRTGGKGS